MAIREHRSVWYENQTVYYMDQRRIPQQMVVKAAKTVDEVVEAIVTLAVRGAPAISLAGAYGLVLARDRGENLEESRRKLLSSRPTAVNLAWAIERMFWVVPEQFLSEARRIDEENEANDRLLARYGATLIQDGDVVLTHCHTGYLASGGYGTALGVLRMAFEEGKRFEVLVDETRPLLQGARLTAWELDQLGIPFHIITDSMAGHFMGQGRVQKVIVGADRVTAQGDVANKIGTYSLAVLARHHKIPFYVASPFSTLDVKILSGLEIPIEERSSIEVTRLVGRDDFPAYNPAFDVTPYQLIDAIITEKGIFQSPYHFHWEGTL